MGNHRKMESLASRLAHALEEWGCQPDGEALRGGMSEVLPVRRGDQELMLKLLPRAEAAREALALQAFPPSVSVRYLDHHDELGALLLERLTSDSLAGMPPDRSITIQADLARRLAVPDPSRKKDAIQIERLASDGWLVHLEGLLHRAPRVVSERAIGAALEAITDLGTDPATTLTHGDLHSRNVHRDRDGFWRVIDPAPRVGTIAYESHTVIVERDRLGELIADGPRELRRRLEHFSDVAAVPLDLAERLCQARAVSSALHEAIEGNAGLAAELAWMAESLSLAR
ncbi:MULTISPECIES: aminoglycoside phosphotransferase family protein [Arthrobacter]|uniref:Streptomycin 6-kinase n=1 Tax=Arthrobacter terricola TaxID=2547396 RepID=A0A4R5KC84_9MICC|nr:MULTISPECIES: aminoglycoside phosphotransferase family protein [Arthrobacter]MBT8162604.1 aminoglycoside phosphotransferase family protein [Arthrobacter sp. GN70]TDF92841.1 hypothetical protein E1809_16915 [Arthrobacter terricola]